MSDILVYVLHYEGAFNKNSLGAVSEAGRLAPQIGGEAHAVVIGGDDLTDELCAQLGNYGATKVFRAKGQPEGLAQPVVDVMAKVMGDNGHDYALFGGGLLGFEIGAGLAARIGAGVTMEVTDVRVDGGKLIAQRPILQDSSISESQYKDKGIIIGRLNAFDAAESGGSATVEDVDVELSPWSTQAKMVKRGEQRGADVDIEGADYLVAGGRGLGAIQHKVGMQGSENIVAINKDSNAPIFEFSDLGIIGDLHKIVPKLTEAIKAKRGG
jgi:electron transfer flavoprotein alpha subunit